MARARTKWVYLFANGKAQGNAKMRDLLGGKGAGLAEMTNAKLPVPPGFTITTAACNAYFAGKEKLPPGLWDQVEKALATIERAAKKKLGDPKDPLLVSVRSGAAMSMPGMMDTVLNLGLNDESRKGLAKLTKNERFAWDAYRRFISMFGRIVLDIPAEKFDHALEAKKKAARVQTDPELSPKQLEELVDEFKAIVRKETGKPFPTEPKGQLRLAIEAVFGSWFGQRAKDYRNAQDLEFTIERGKLYMLQTRSAKRTAAAAVKIATDMVREGLITKDEALRRVEPAQVEQLLLPRFDQTEVERARNAGRYLAKGLNASPGAATGRAVFDADRAVVLKGQKQLVVLVRPETSPDDFHGMVAATGILTARGGSTSHAAVVARGLGLPCVAGCTALDIDLQKREMRVDGKVIKEGEAISIDGTTGEVFAGELPTIAANFREEKELIELLSWADKRRKLGVWVNADTPGECRLARELGAEGVGLARTEHMFREAERLPIVQDMILAGDTAGRKRALAKLLPFQQGDFNEMFEAMDGLPVVIRLIDPPLHEFLREYADINVEIAVAQATGRNGTELEKKARIFRRLEQLPEDNPMLGLRGYRLLLVTPEIFDFPTLAILGAPIDSAAKG